jgi:23S rRNA (cytosine1962-C5)-methyltransferase
LLDFGAGRKLERFGKLILDRPSPAAEGLDRRHRDWWQAADFRFLEASGWSPESPPENWLWKLEPHTLELRLAPFGHVGLFPEQIGNWRWLRLLAKQSPRPIQVLNLFAYTGGSTLALAAAGAHVVHVDASQPTVKWARRNAELSSLANHPIRWIVDDVREFVDRELRRKRRYDLIVMDPPAYGHGVDGRDWQIERDLDSLVEQCLQLISPKPVGFLLTGHSPVDDNEASPLHSTNHVRLQQLFSSSTTHRVGLLDRNQRKLDFGWGHRWS